MNVELTVEQLAIIEDALNDCLIYDNGGDRDAQCEVLAKVQNAMGCTPPTTAAIVRQLADDARLKAMGADD